MAEAEHISSAISAFEKAAIITSYLVHLHLGFLAISSRRKIKSAESNIQTFKTQTHSSSMKARTDYHLGIGPGSDPEPELGLETDIGSETDSQPEPEPEPETQEQKQGGVFYTPENSHFYNSFTYDTIEPSSRAIRLLEVSPSRVRGRISCKLFPAQRIEDIDDKYTALSYCAGDPKKTETILVNGINFNVFANLGHALKQAIKFWKKSDIRIADEEVKQTRGETPWQRQTRTRYLIWIDQICISQPDKSERSHQVGLMREIYASANEVLICISTPDTPAVMTNCFVVSAQHETSYQTKSRFVPTTPCCLCLPKVRPNRHLSADRDLHNFLLAPWWQRAWVYQEFIVSRKACFLFHGKNISWGSLKTHADYLDDILFPDYMRSSRYQEDFHPYTRVEHIWEGKLRHGPGTDIFTLLGRTQNLSATDHRDRIYSLLGLTDIDYSIGPDYSAKNTTSCCFIGVAKAIIESTSRLDVIAFACEISPSLPDRLPSWVPDWTGRWMVNMTRAEEAVRGFLTGTGNSKGSGLTWKFDGRSLQVRGRRLDEMFYNPMYDDAADDGDNRSIEDRFQTICYKIQEFEENVVTCQIDRYYQPRLGWMEEFMIRDHHDRFVFTQSPVRLGFDESIHPAEFINYDFVFPEKVRIINDASDPRPTLEADGGSLGTFNLAIPYEIELKRPKCDQCQNKRGIFRIHRRLSHMANLDIWKTYSNVDVSVLGDYLTKKDARYPREGDQIWELAGLFNPVVLRKEGDFFRLISNVYHSEELVDCRCPIPGTTRRSYVKQTPPEIRAPSAYPLTDLSDTEMREICII